MNIQQQLQSYAEKHGLSMSKIGHGQSDNPFPVGRRNAYSAYLGKPISSNTRAKLFEFFTNIAQSND